MKKRKPYKNSIPESKWELVKDEYVHGYIGDDGLRVSAPTGKELIERHKICRSTFYARCRDENWDRDRYTYYLKMKEAQEAKYIDLRVNEAFNFDSKCFQYAVNNLDRIQRLWSEAEAKDVPGLASAMEKIQKVARLTVGESTEVIRNVTSGEEDDNVKSILDKLYEDGPDGKTGDPLLGDVENQSPTETVDTKGDTPRD